MGLCALGPAGVLVPPPHDSLFRHWVEYNTPLISPQAPSVQNVSAPSINGTNSLMSTFLVWANSSGRLERCDYGTTRGLPSAHLDTPQTGR